jgi:internalin A
MLCMTAEEAYAKALCRILEAEKSGALNLDLTRLPLDQLPRELARLTSLQELGLSWCKRPVGDLSSLAGLTSLQKLGLYDCGPLTDLSPLSGLTSLKWLGLYECGRLTDLSPLRGLTALQRLNLSRCGQLSVLSPLSGLTSLQKLELSNCGRLSDLSPLSGLTLLQDLKLSECEQLSDLSPLAALISLQKLELFGCGRLSDLTPLSGLTSLQKLELSECGQLSDLTPLSGLTSLRELDLSWCGQLSNLSPLSGLISLRALDLSSFGQLADLSPLSVLTSLQTLNLSEHEQLGNLSPLSGLTSLRALDLSRCRQLGNLSPLSGLTALQELKLSWCEQLSDLSSLAGLTALQTLDLSRCEQLTDLSPLSGLTALQELKLSWCEQLSDLSSLAGLTALQTLDLSRCEQLTDLSALSGLTSLRTLDLSRCGQLGNLSPLSGLTALQELKLSWCEQLSDLSPLAGQPALQTLDLSRCERLSELSPLSGLTSLQTLELSGCGRLRDLSSLSGLASLQTLELSSCERLSDLSPLSGLTSLQVLNLSGCTGAAKFTPLVALVSILQGLRLFGCRFDDLPAEIYGQNEDQNVLSEVRAHLADLQSGKYYDAELKLFILGNGGVGKTQLSRRLRDLPYDPQVKITHGVELRELQTSVDLENFQGPVRLNLWDFGGQDIYHGSHTHFLHAQAVFSILWTPQQQAAVSKWEMDSARRPLAYWLDYLRAAAGTDSPVIIVQSQCDEPHQRAHLPVTPPEEFKASWTVEMSAKTGFGLERFKGTLKDAAWTCLHHRPPPPIGKSRVTVRDRLREILTKDQQLPPAQRRHRLLEREEFDRLCAEVGQVSDKEALLKFLHNNGVLFYREGFCKGRIVLDQNWALEIIYALFNPNKTLPLLRGHGRFTRKELERLIWAEFTPDQQQVFLDMMESCSICFRVRQNPHDEWEFIAPELLPEWSSAEEMLLGRLRDDPADAEASARYLFLHEGILRGFLSKLGRQAKDAAIYWKYGCWFYEKKKSSQVLVKSHWDDAASDSGAGTIRLQAWGERADELIEILAQALQSLPVGQRPEIERTVNAKPVASSHRTEESRSDASTGLEGLEISSRSHLPDRGSPPVYVSYAHGDDSSEEAQQRTAVVDRLCQTFDKGDWHIVRDSNIQSPGMLISGFMKQIASGGRVIIILSDKYLRSPYCMTELHSIYEESVRDKEDFLRRIIPLRLADARIDNWRVRVTYAKHWATEFQAMEQDFTHLGVEDHRLYKAMQRWHNEVGDMLAYVNDVFQPRSFEEIVKDDFAGLRQMFQLRPSSQRF